MIIKKKNSCIYLNITDDINHICEYLYIYDFICTLKRPLQKRHQLKQKFFAHILHSLYFSTNFRDQGVQILAVKTEDLSYPPKNVCFIALQIQPRKTEATIKQCQNRVSQLMSIMKLVQVNHYIYG